MIAFLLCAYGIAFGLMNKLPDKAYAAPSVDVGEPTVPFWVKLLRCSYCVGFWAGVLAWLGLCICGMEAWPKDAGEAFTFPVRGFISAAWCYGCDTLLRAGEFLAGDEDDEDDE
jgi:hypothetical protein